ncbi:histidinol dehydrogenase, partial [Methylogaea oryzae]
MSEVMINRLDAADGDFQDKLDKLLSYDASSDEAVHQRVLEIIGRIRREGDGALLEYTQRFDQYQLAGAADLELPKARLQQAWDNLPNDLAEGLQFAAERIRTYAEQQKLQSWRFEDADGNVLGQQVTPLDRVGLYVPGGKAAYPSSVLMNAIPAKVAGVPEVIMVTPTPLGEVNELVLAAAHLAGVDRVYRVG